MTTVDGLPAHILLVHAVVVLVPLTALLLVLVAAWPAARLRLAMPTAALALLTAVVVPVTTESGEWLEHRVEPSALLRAHTQLGDTMVPWAIGLAVVALVLAARELRTRRPRQRVSIGGRGPGTARSAAARSSATTRGSRVLSLLIALVTVVVAVGSVVTVYRIGESGTRAVWTGQFTEQAQLPTGKRPATG